jgi:hypothetical protein
MLRTTVLEVDGMAAGEDERVVEGVVGRPDLHVRDVGRVADADRVVEQDAGHIGRDELVQKPPLAPAPRPLEHLGAERAHQRPVGTLGIEKGALARVLEDLAHVAPPTRDNTRQIERLRSHQVKRFIRPCGLRREVRHPAGAPPSRTSRGGAGEIISPALEALLAAAPALSSPSNRQPTQTLLNWW